MVNCCDRAYHFSHAPPDRHFMDGVCVIHAFIEVEPCMNGASQTKVKNELRTLYLVNVYVDVSATRK